MLSLLASALCLLSVYSIQMDAHRFCVDCKHNVVQAHDIFMGKMELEGCENEEEYDEVRYLVYISTELRECVRLRVYLEHR